MFKNRNLNFKIALVCLLMLLCAGLHVRTFSVWAQNAFPFYDLKPSELVLRSKFYTSYNSSSSERKNNIFLAAKSLDNTFIDVGGEFSFNSTVGPRTRKRGYQNAKIIVNGEFVEGVGGGVCQVSTTLYNAVLLAGLNITEFHPHSLQVGYVAPSFDAMVNSGSADLRFINNTHNPIILKVNADGEKLTVSVYGEPSEIKYQRKSVIKEEIPAPEEQVVFDDDNEYPDLYEGEFNVIRYSKKGLKSEGYLIQTIDGVEVGEIKIRSDKYAATKGLIVYGRAVRPEESINSPEEENLSDKIMEKLVKYKKYFDKYDFL